MGGGRGVVRLVWEKGGRGAGLKRDYRFSCWEDKGNTERGDGIGVCSAGVCLAMAEGAVGGGCLLMMDKEVWKPHEPLDLLPTTAYIRLMQIRATSPWPPAHSTSPLFAPKVITWLSSWPQRSSLALNPNYYRRSSRFSLPATDDGMSHSLLYSRHACVEGESRDFHDFHDQWKLLHATLLRTRVLLCQWRHYFAWYQIFLPRFFITPASKFVSNQLSETRCDNYISWGLGDGFSREWLPITVFYGRSQ